MDMSVYCCWKTLYHAFLVTWNFNYILEMLNVKLFIVYKNCHINNLISIFFSVKYLYERFLIANYNFEMFSCNDRFVNKLQLKTW